MMQQVLYKIQVSLYLIENAFKLFTIFNFLDVSIYEKVQKQ